MLTYFEEQLVKQGPRLHGKRTCKCHARCKHCGWGPHASIHHWTAGHSYEPKRSPANTEGAT